ncbi:hypothetical protein FB446DRAFT_704955 [Lentinula raphanica]|nr:hypothetical protein FB446DRAFT_704955 [Lentinula raphanica]
MSSDAFSRITFLYFRIFASDALRYKLLVGWIWATDVVHTVLVCTSVWQYLILCYLPKYHSEFRLTVSTVAITIATTAVVTLSVNRFSYLSSELDLLSCSEIYVSPLITQATTVEMLITKTFPEFATKFKILFTSGLFVSAVTDVIISVARYYYLRNLKQGYLPTQEVVDTVVLTIFNDTVPLITLMTLSAVVIASIGFWLGMPHNFVYLGIYFTISKFYSNSVLAILNLRNWYRHQYTWNRPYGLSMIRTMNNDGSRTHAHDRATSMIPSSSGSPSKHAHPESPETG